MKINIYSTDGKKESVFEANDAIFGLKPNDKLLSQAVKVQLACRRKTIADTLTRAEVRGGGKKPWRQKGTGRARAGSTRSPLWRSGGVIFGPSAKNNFTLELPKKMRQKSIHIAFSQKAAANQIYIISDIKAIDRKNLMLLLNSLKIEDKKILFLTDPNTEKDIVKKIRNIAGVTVIGTNSINLFDLLNNDVVFVSKESIKKIND